MTDTEETLHYCAYLSYSWDVEAGRGLAPAVEPLVAEIEAAGVEIRGTYATTAFRAECDILFWLLADSTLKLDAAARAIRTSGLAPALTPYWNAIGVHQEAEFNRAHVPAFVAGEPAGDFICLYPFVRSLEWYLLEDEERRELLAEHGMLARDYKDVRANTVSTFGLSDYEWLLAFEASEPVRIVQLMRELRAARARLHTREELPFINGIRRPLAEIVKGLE
ncbi:MAG TPA: chlorite dismutase family protein [Solirubrobacterales bacterium]|nr:chlorite dismutase family protein [Solirubrobacterales bacterium]HNA24223.1 chlorite dismutase family protein [Solirubrobacterales bacterium]HNA44429.1 chlorite dismutase family protein [Solirubrobacterales bacterium]HNC14774.1 chlorite dismutase family protein [Solirubrobacterales bacterium]HNE77123.1 chlorite dismutase family protein [Solirubrobacterales bacterium]